MSNTSASPNPPSQTPKFIWPRTGQDLPRLPFADWLKVYALGCNRACAKVFGGNRLFFCPGRLSVAMTDGRGS